VVRNEPTQGELRSELLAEIAVGTTARVELCRVSEGARQGELVAVKRLHSHIADDPAFVDMFRDEVWMTAALKHPHVVEVVGWGRDEHGPWLAVELVRGVSLQRLMKTVFETGEKFSERMVVYLARCVCAGLAEAHSLRSSTGEHLNLVHRDLTPGNVLLGFRGEVKIADFGIAKAKQRLTKTLTGLLKGQPQYMSPEQVHGQPIDARSDIFALGVVLFELFSGRRPWQATNDLEAMRAITDADPADLKKLRPKIDKALVQVVEQCLQKDAAKRFQSAADLGGRLDQWLMVHGYRDGNQSSLGRFVRRNAMRQMRWFERAVVGEFATSAKDERPVPMASSSPPQDATRPDHPISDATPRALGSGSGQHGDQDEEIDWGEDGPTLIQKSDGKLPKLPQRGSSARPRIPSVEPPTRKLEGGSQPPPEQKEESQLTTVPGNKPRIEDSDDADDGDATVQLSEERRRVRMLLDADRKRAERPGVVAPPDPDVPPLPPSTPPPPQTLQPSSDGQTPVLQPSSDGQTPVLAGPGPISTPAPPHSAAPVAIPAPLSVSPVPSASPFSGLASSNYPAEAHRLAEVARRADEFAQAAKRAAELAHEAAMLASSGQTLEASKRLAEAHQIDGGLRASQPVPGAEFLIMGDTEGVSRQHMRAAFRRTQIKEVATIVGVVVVVLLVVVLFAALLM